MKIFVIACVAAAGLARRARRDTGLQFTTLDGGSQGKQFDTSDLDLRIVYLCPNAGRPGAANAPDFNRSPAVRCSASRSPAHLRESQACLY